MSFVTRVRNSRTCCFVSARPRSPPPSSSRARSSRNCSIAPSWPAPALSSCPASSSVTIRPSRSPTSEERAWSKASRSTAARRGSVVASTSASRRNDRSRSTYCRVSSASRRARTSASPPAGFVGSPRPTPPAASVSIPHTTAPQPTVAARRLDSQSRKRKADSQTTEARRVRGKDRKTGCEPIMW